MKLPAASLFTTKVWPVDVLVIRTVASGIAAPLVESTFPLMLPASCSCPNAPPSNAKISAKLARQQYFLLSSPDTILWANFLIHLDWIWTNDNCHCAGG